MYDRCLWMRGKIGSYGIALWDTDQKAVEVRLYIGRKRVGSINIASRRLVVWF